MPAAKIAHLTPFRDPFSSTHLLSRQRLGGGRLRGGDGRPARQRRAARRGPVLRPAEGTQPPRANHLDGFRCLRRGLAAKRPTSITFTSRTFILWGLLLRLLGKPVIYDVHEDYVTAAAVRPWLPGWTRPLLAGCRPAAQCHSSAGFRHRHRRTLLRPQLSGAVQVLNYAKLEEYAEVG